MRTIGSTYHILLSWGSGTHQPFHCDYCIQMNIPNLLTNIWALEKRYNIHNVFTLHQQISIACGWVKGILCKISSSCQLCLITTINANEKSLPLLGFQPSMRVCLYLYVHIQESCAWFDDTGHHSEPDKHNTEWYLLRKVRVCPLSVMFYYKLLGMAENAFFNGRNKVSQRD